MYIPKIFRVILRRVLEKWWFATYKIQPPSKYRTLIHGYEMSNNHAALKILFDMFADSNLARLVLNIYF